VLLVVLEHVLVERRSEEPSLDVGLEGEEARVPRALELLAARDLVLGLLELVRRRVAPLRDPARERLVRAFEDVVRVSGSLEEVESARRLGLPRRLSERRERLSVERVGERRVPEGARRRVARLLPERPQAERVEVSLVAEDVALELEGPRRFSVGL